MDKKIGLENALNILGVEQPQKIRFEMKLVLQGLEEREYKGQTFQLSSCVGIIADSPQLDLKKHEMLVGYVTFEIVERYQDNAGTLKGSGLAGLVTGGGFDPNSYDTHISGKDRRK